MLVSRRSDGFTLVELLVVVAIMGVLLALVGPLGVEFSDKVRAQNEFLELGYQLRRDSARAFLTSSSIEYHFAGQGLTVSGYSSGAIEQTFEFISFEQSQYVIFNTAGFPSRSSIELVVNGRAEEIDLVALVL